jgi:hypothetical protein
MLHPKGASFVYLISKIAGAMDKSHEMPQFGPDQQRFFLAPSDFALVNPNTNTAPIFRTRADAELVTQIYRRLPVLVDRSATTEARQRPVRYSQVINMTSDSAEFWDSKRLQAEGAYPLEDVTWRKGEEHWVRLYEGKMVQAFDHRAADVVVNPSNLYRPGQPAPLSPTDHADPTRLASPQNWITAQYLAAFSLPTSVIGFKDVTSPTNERTMIAAFLPTAGYGNNLPVLLSTDATRASEMVQWLGLLNSYIFDYCARSKVQGQHLNWFIVEQLPVLSVEHYGVKIGTLTASEIVRDHVLRLTYTACDMELFARDMGYVGEDGAVKPPIIWNEGERRHLRARLDALYFILYGVTDEEDIRYILSTFPIVDRKDRDAFDGVYLTCELIVWYKRALQAGDANSFAPEAELIRRAKAQG